MNTFGAKALAVLSYSTTLTGIIVFCLLVAVVLVWFSLQERRERALMAAVKMVRAADIATLAPGTAVAVEGTLRSAAPLSGEYSGKPCAYFKAEIVKQETWYETDSDNKRSQKSQDTILQSNTRYAPCEIEDGSGRVALDLTGADIEAIEAVNELIDGDVKAVSGLVGAVIGIGRENVTTTRKESHLPLDIPVYVLGEVRPGGTIAAPAKGSRNKIFVVSRKSAEERSRHLAEMSTFGLKFAIASAAISVLLFAFAWYKAN